MQAAIDRLEEYTESQLFGPYANGARFSLNNNFKGEYQPWAEKQEIDHTTKGDKLNAYSELSAAELRKLAAEDDAPDGSTGTDQA